MLGPPNSGAHLLEPSLRALARSRLSRRLHETSKSWKPLCTYYLWISHHRCHTTSVTQHAYLNSTQATASKLLHAQSGKKLVTAHVGRSTAKNTDPNLHEPFEPNVANLCSTQLIGTARRLLTFLVRRYPYTAQLHAFSLTQASSSSNLKIWGSSIRTWNDNMLHPCRLQCRSAERRTGKQASQVPAKLCLGLPIQGLISLNPPCVH